MTGVPRLDRLNHLRLGHLGLGHLGLVAGFAGAVALAASAYLGGALPHGDLASTPTRILASPNGPVTLALWLTGTALMVTGWLLAGRGGPLSVRWVLGATALWAAPLAFAPPLGSRDVYAYACQGAAYAAGLDPYAVGPAAMPCPWLDSISYIWRNTPAPYGPLYVALTGGAVWLADSNLTVAVALLRIPVLVGLALTAVYLPRLARACGADEARATWLALASPLVGVHLVSGAHNDALMIGLGVAGLVYAQRRHPALSGACFGLAVAVKATAGVALPFAVLLASRGARPVVVAARMGLACLGAYGLVSLATGLGLGWIRALGESGRSVQWTSVPTGVGLAVGYLGRLFGADITGGAIAVARVVALVVLLGVLAALWWRARGGDAREVVAGCGLALLAAMLLAPVFHPWYWLWPLTVFAAVHAVKGGARRPLWWLVVATAALSFLVLPDGYNLARSTRLVGAFAILAAVAATVVAGVTRRSWSCSGD